MATRLDVAHLAGTSPALVSYVLNGGPRKVAPGTAARIRAAIDQLDDPEREGASGAQGPGYTTRQDADVLSDDDGNLYGMPITVDTGMVMYRADLFDEWGIQAPELPESWSWDEFYDVAQTVEDKLSDGSHPGMYPVTLAAGAKNNGAVFSGIAQNSAGNEMFDGSTPTFDTPEAKTGWDYWTGLGPAGINVTSPDVVNSDYNEILATFQTEGAAIAFEWQSAAGVLEDPEQSPATAGKIGYTMIPYATTPDQARIFPSIHSLAITKTTEHPEAAFAFATWFSSKEVGAVFALRGVINSGRESIMTDPTVVEVRPEFPATLEAAKLYHQNPKGIRSYYDFMDQVLGPNTNAVFSGSVDQETGLANLQRDAEAYVKKGS